MRTNKKKQVLQSATGEVIEQLESRTMLAITCSVGGSGSLDILGDATAADTISIGYDTVNSKVTVTPTGGSFTDSTADTLDGGSGTDDVLDYDGSDTLLNMVPGGGG
jgi:hypothetical protein